MGQISNLNFLLWNVGGKRLDNHLIRMIGYYDINIIILLEHPEHDVNFINSIRTATGKNFFYSLGHTDRVKIFADFPPKYIRPVLETPRYTIRLLNTPIIYEHILVALHLPSKLRLKSRDQRVIASNLARDLNDVERERGHKRSIVVGDFNMDPFEEGMVQVDALNSVSSSDVANMASGSRVFQRKKYWFFYNPMWGLFGDQSNCPPGTYFHHSPASMSRYWRMFDQVIYRPTLIDDIPVRYLQIVDFDGEFNLVDESGRPSKTISDHLPITFRLEAKGPENAEPV